MKAARTAVPALDSLIATASFNRGHRYSEWRDGDQVAKYGLTALVVGGAGVAAVKLGLFPKLIALIAKLLAKLGKLIVVAIAGLIAGIKKAFTRRKEATA